MSLFLKFKQTTAAAFCRRLNFVLMKKSTIWVIAALVGFTFATLLFLQAKYFEEVIAMRREQFNESVTRSLYQAARILEMSEMRKSVEESKIFNAFIIILEIIILCGIIICRDTNTISGGRI